MIPIFDLRGFDCATIPVTLRPRLQDLIQHTTDNDLLDLTVVLVIEAGDTEQDVVREIAWSPLNHPIDGTRYGEPGFVPYWASLTDDGGWWRLIHPVSNDGFAYVLFIEPGGFLDSLWREYAQ